MNEVEQIAEGLGRHVVLVDVIHEDIDVFLAVELGVYFLLIHLLGAVLRWESGLFDQVNLFAMNAGILQNGGKLGFGEVRDEDGFQRLVDGDDPFQLIKDGWTVGGIFYFVLKHLGGSRENVDIGNTNMANHFLLYS